jgi:hypothetical protein
VHLWDWPKHPVADVETEAKANEIRLSSGQIGLHRLYSEAGMDLEDEIPEMARTFGVTDDVIRQRLLDVILPPPKQLQSALGGDAESESESLRVAAADILRNRINGHGVNGHAN